LGAATGTFDIALTSALLRCAWLQRAKYFSRFAVARSAIGHWLVKLVQANSRYSMWTTKLRNG
jgi:hypothetical protein